MGSHAWITPAQAELLIALEAGAGGWLPRTFLGYHPPVYSSAMKHGWVNRVYRGCDAFEITQLGRRVIAKYRKHHP